MLEIKNIVNRKIDGNPKPEYWIQMQLQMEVCDLDECDFLETQFIEYENESEFKKDGTFHKTANGKQKGMLLYFVKNGEALANQVNCVVRQLTLPAGETFTFDTEKIVLEAGDRIFCIASPDIGSSLTDLAITVSYLEV